MWLDVSVSILTNYDNIIIWKPLQAENIVHYKVDCDATSVSKSAQLHDEREVKLKGINGSDSVFYKTVCVFCC